ncbi:MAG: ABC transporter transmembrane domain-containing protein, partial [bacterium]
MRAELAYYIDLHRSRLRDLAWTTLLFLLQPLVLVIALLKIREIFDLAVNGEDHGALIWLGLSIIGLYVFSMTLSLLVRRRMLIITRGIIRELRQDIFSALYSYSRAAYTQFDRKRLQTMLVQDVIRVDVMSNAVAGQLLPNALICLAIVTVLLYLNSLLFLLTIILIPTLAIILSLARPKIKRLVKRYHGQLESVQNQTLFNLEAIDLTHAQGAEAAELQRQDETGLWFRKTTDKLTLLREFLSVLQDTVMLTVSIGCLIGGAWLIREEAMSVGELVAFYAALMLLRPHLSTLWRSLPLALEGIESFRKLYAWINLDDPAPSFGSQTPNVNGDISFDNVAFDYPGKPLLADVSFTVQPGGKVAIYGDNGSGKSTLTYLLLGFYQPVSGAIRIDGTPLADLDIRLFREKIGIVPQNPYIFQGTIWENITYGVDHPLA